MHTREDGHIGVMSCNYTSCHFMTLYVHTNMHELID